MARLLTMAQEAKLSTLPFGGSGPLPPPKPTLVEEAGMSKISDPKMWDHPGLKILKDKL